MQFPKEICLLGPADSMTCQFCDGKGRWQIHEDCRTCAGSGNKPHATGEVCPRCGGSGLYDRDRQLECFPCKGIGRVLPKCRSCNGVGKVAVKSQTCAKCDGSGSMLLSQALGTQGTIEETRKLVDVMQACLEEADPTIRERGKQLYNLLRDTYRHARRVSSEHVRKLFPDDLTAAIQAIISTTPADGPPSKPTVA